MLIPPSCRLLTVLSLALLTLAACGPSGPDEKDPQEVVTELAQQRWGLLLERDFEAAWDFKSPGFREMTFRQDYAMEMARRPVRWLTAEVSAVECEPEVCVVTIEGTYQAPGARHGLNRMELPRVTEERWIRVDGQWWHVSE